MTFVETSGMARPEGEARLRGATGAWEWDLSRGRLRGDARFASLYGLDPDRAAEGLPSDVFFERIHPDDRLRLRIAVAGIAHGAELFSRDYRLTTDTGVRWLSARGRAVHDNTGKPLRFAGVLIDVTEQKRAQERLRVTQTAGGVGTFEYEEGFGTVSVSDQFCRLLGLHVAEALPVRTINRVVHPDDPPLIGSMSDAASTQSELRIRRADTGEERWLARRGERVSDSEDGGSRFIGVIYDVTAAKMTEVELLKLTQSLEALAEERTQQRNRLWNSSRDLLVVVGADGVPQSFNPAWESALGYDADQLTGGRFGDLVHPDDLAILERAWPRSDHAGSTDGFDLRLRAKDGDWRWINWGIVSAEGVFYAIGRDITERRHLEEQLRQSQKMEAIGQLTGGLAHDFNNMLTGIMGGLDVVRRRLAEGRIEEVDRFIRVATSSAERAAALTHRLLAFSRRQTLDPQPLDLNALVASMQELLTRTIGEHIELSVELDPELWTTSSDANQLESAILNLAINGRDAMPSGGKLTIRTRNAEALSDADQAGSDGDFVAISVSDTGIGIPPEIIERVFDPFFTTKPLGEGTGLGLSMVHGFVHQCGGRVAISSAPGSGSTVELFLPRTSEAPKAQVDKLVPAPEGEGETVLVVEDDVSVRMLVMSVLKELGYQPVEAADTTEALAILESARPIDLLVSDVGLPGLNGRQLAEIARERRPGLPVLFMTGYAAAARRSELLGPQMEMISKPFAVDALAVKIREMIESG